MVKRSLFSACVLLTVLLGVFPTTSMAGIYTDDMARCLVESTTEDDRNQLVKWMFSAVSVHPALASVSAVTEEQRALQNKKTAELFMRLITETCREKTIKSIKYEGAQSIGAAFETFGQAAAQGLFSDPSVAKEVESLGSYIDENKLKGLGLNN